MRCAVLFLPETITVFTRRLTSVFWYLPSLAIGRLVAVCLRDMIIYSLNYFAAAFAAFGFFTPYLERLTRRFSTPAASNVPRTM